MAEVPKQADGSEVTNIQQRADDFARRQYADVWKRFEQRLKPASEKTGEGTGQDDTCDSPSDDG